MKNFQDLINQKQNAHEQKLSYPTIGELRQQTYLDKVKSISIKVLVPIGLSLITSPFTTVSTLLQITNKRIINPIESKLKMIDPKDITYKHVKNGIYGDTKPYRPFQFKNYVDALKQMGKQGLRGIYKGNLMGMLYLGINSKFRAELYSRSTQIVLTEQQQKQRNFVKENLITIATCTLADILTLPLMFCQSRLILQNSLSNYRTYKNPLQIVKSVSLRDLFVGGSLLLVKNSVFCLAWLQLIKQSPTYSFVISSILSHFLTYPFVTVIRQMQVNSPNTPMMYDRSERVRQTVRRIWNHTGVTGFYRGFIGYGIVHFFMGLIMVQQNIRTGFFEQLQ